MLTATSTSAAQSGQLCSGMGCSGTSFGAGSVTGRLLGTTVLRVRVRTGEKVFTFDATPGWHLAFEQPAPVEGTKPGHDTSLPFLLRAKLSVAIEAGLQDPGQVRVVVIRGAGRVFSAGGGVLQQVVREGGPARGCVC